MAYGIWLYKEITTSNGVIRLEIKKKNYTGESIEIEALLKDGLTLQVDGRDITDPIIGTTLSISLIDTGQIDTSQFFTPDATLYQVVLYRDSVRIWIGYLTPDSYSENLVYSDVINLTARDNLGRLNDFIYDKSEGLQAVYQFIERLCERASISMPLVFYSGITAKRVAESEVDTSLRGVAASVDTLRFVGMNYREIVEMILKGIGCQMRYSYNTDRGYFLGVYDISQLYSELSTQEAFFVEKSGYKEIKPAWREVLIEQDYGLSSNLFDGYFSKDELAGAETFLPEDIDNNRWGGDGSMLFCNQYLAKVDDFQSTSLFIAADRSDSYCFYRKNVFKSDNVLTFKMQLNNTLRMMPSYVSDYDTIGNLYVGYHIESNPDLQPVQYFETYTLKYKFNVYLVGRDTGITYVMRDKWIPLSEDDAEPITFEMAQVWYNDPSLWDRIEQVEIVVNSTPEDGELRLVVYAAEGAAIAPISTIHQTTFAKISNIEIAYQNDIQGASSRIEVNAAHNLKSNINLEIGQVPNNKGNNLAYWGGLFDSVGYPLNSWVLNDGDIVRYNLMELVARQHIHQNSKNYALLSGVMMSDSALSLTHNVTYKGKVYSILSASHNLINGKMNVTSMQEIEAYQVAELTVIDSPLESSTGTRLGSGENEVIQFSNDAGNAKRLYELDEASADDIDKGFAILDYSGLTSARRVALKDIGAKDFNDAFEIVKDDNGVITHIIAKVNFYSRGGITARYSDGGSGGGGGASNLWELGDVSIVSPADGESLVYDLASGKWVNRLVEGGGLDVDAMWSALATNDNSKKINISHIPDLSGTYMQINDGGIPMSTTTNLNRVGYGYVDGGWLYSGPAIAFGSANGYTALIQQKAGDYELRVSYKNNGVASGTWKTVAFTSNLEDYLPLSGGTIYSGAQNPLNIKGSATYASISFTLDNTTYKSYLLYKGETNWSITSENWGTEHTLIHSGNYSNYALPKSGGTIDSTSEEPITINSNQSQVRLLVQRNITSKSTFGWHTTFGTWMYDHTTGKSLGIRDTDGTPFYYDTTFRTLIHSGNIGSYAPIYNSSGYVGIGTTTPLTKLDVDGGNARITSYGVLFRDSDKPNGYNPTYMSEIYQWQDSIFFTRNNPTTGSFIKSVASLNLKNGNFSATGNIYATGGITAKTSSSSSDAKLKDNITLMSQEDAINILMALKPSSWNWKNGGELAYGLVAQDVESVLPCSVTYGEHLSLQYNMFHAFEISVAQNHETRLQYLEREIQTLKREYYGKI